ncbi:amino acid transporter [Geomicrobium halophilum]|uniref:Amino acid transporter n=1 Tax=Geomicrobium halophilum TaxID=549000 RepID=A0A841PJ22_9BACL|nr:APC family permease [Geomicrobium halophilum]MBB6448729.1 amino acid transporter [Geomicrobium halophilum]
MEDREGKLKKVLSNWDVFLLSFGAMIGWGWVVLSGTWITSAGSLGAALAFVIGGVLVVFVGLTYAELSSAMPFVGGEHVYVGRALGNKSTFIASWAITFGYVSVIAFEAVALPTVITYLFPNYEVGYMWTIAGWDVYASWVIVGMAGSIIMAGINYFGVKPAAKVQIILTLSIFIVGILLITGSGFGGSIANMEPFFVDGAGGIMAVLVLVPFLFVGFDVIPQAAEEANISPRKIGRLLILSVVGAILFYIGVTLSVGLALPATSLEGIELATADAMAAAFGSQAFANILILGGVAGILTSWNAFIVGGTRIIYAMAESRMLPSWFGKLHPKYGTPSNAIIFIGVLSVLSPLLGEPALDWFANAGGLGIVVAYLMVAISFIILRRREPDLERPYKAGNSQFVGVAAVVLSLGFIVLYMPGMPSALFNIEWLIVLGWSLLGLVFYLNFLSKKG